MHIEGLQQRYDRHMLGQEFLLSSRVLLYRGELRIRLLAHSRHHDLSYGPTSDAQ